MIASKKEPSIHEIENHIKVRNCLSRETVKRGDLGISMFASGDTLDPIHIEKERESGA